MSSQRNTFIPSHYVVKTWFVSKAVPILSFTNTLYHNVYTFLHLSEFRVFLFNQVHTNIFHLLRIDVFICQHLQINLIGAVHTPFSTQQAFFSQHNSSLSLNKLTLMYLNGVEITTPCCPRTISDRDSSCFSLSYQTSGVSHNALFIGPLARSPFSPDWLCFLPPEECHHCCVSKEEINSAALKTLLIFSHRGKKSHICIVSFAFDVGL